MLAAVNVGNTHIRLGLFENGELRETWRLRTGPYRTADEYVYLLSGLFRESGHDNIDSSVCASVVPPLSEVFRTTLKRISGAEPIMVSSELKTGIRIGTKHPSELGADLLANAVGAFHSFHESCTIVDFGTALTFTRVNADGVLTGVAIAPGIGAALTSLIADTAQLHQIELIAPPLVLAQNTTHAIQSGIVFGYASLVTGMIDRIRAETGETDLTIATGGMAEKYAPLIPCVNRVLPNHTLQGLRVLYELNS